MLLYFGFGLVIIGYLGFAASSVGSVLALLVYTRSRRGALPGASRGGSIGAALLVWGMATIVLVVLFFSTMSGNAGSGVAVMGVEMGAFVGGVMGSCTLLNIAIIVGHLMTRKQRQDELDEEVVRR